MRELLGCAVTALVLSIGCGGSTENTSGGSERGGAGIGGGPGSGGGSTGGSRSVGGSASGGISSSGSVGTGATVSGGATSGGVSAIGGSAGAWSEPIVGSCGDLTDEQLRALVYGGPKVPTGYFNDAPAGAILSWDPVCANDLSSARMSAAQALQAPFTESEQSPFYFEFQSTGGPYPRVYRVTKCSFWDGMRLGSFSLKELAGYLWFISNHNVTGNFIVTGVEYVGNATCWFTLCQVMTVYGDFGVCDEISLYERSYSISISDGTVMVTSDMLVRTIQGQCH